VPITGYATAGDYGVCYPSVEVTQGDTVVCKSCWTQLSVGDATPSLASLFHSAEPSASAPAASLRSRPSNVVSTCLGLRRENVRPIEQNEARWPLHLR